ncbi:hypothetical protein ABBQ32_009553 [Trebouxia sp. C0010 RCD-2024]
MSGSIFRRGGQKAEAHGAPGEQNVGTALLEAKLAELHTAWSTPLIASTQSLAVWRTDSQVVEVTIERGHVLQRMGYKHCKKLFLHIEEAVYLVSKGSLLLTLTDAEGQQQLLSLQEATQLMESSGISLSQYQVYSHLMRAGYIVTRHPATWVLDDPPRPGHMASYNTVPEKGVIPEGSGSAATGVPPIPEHISQEATRTLDDAVSMPPSKRTKLYTNMQWSADDHTHRQWWSPASATQTWSLGIVNHHQDDLARLAVGIDQADCDSGQLLPRLRLLPSIPHGAPNEVEVPNDLKLVSLSGRRIFMLHMQRTKGFDQM